MMQPELICEERPIRSGATATPSYIARAASLSPDRGQSLDFPPETSSSLSHIFLYKDNIGQIVTRPSWSRDALSELGNVDNEAAEEGIARPTQVAKENAQRIISSLAYMSLPEPSIYPTEKQEVAIFFKRRSSGILIHCGSKGEGAALRPSRAKVVAHGTMMFEISRMRL